MANEPKYIPNTNIPISVLEGLKDDDPGKWDRVLSRLQSEIQNGDTKAINDALFDVAFYTMMGDGTGNKPGNVEWGLGQGNANVSKIHDGSWTINSNVEPVDWTAWAANYINSPNDVYNQDDDTVVTWDDKLGVLHDGVSIGSWGGNDRGQPPPPKGVRGKPPTNPVISGPGGDSNLRKLWPDVDWDGGGANSGDMDQYDWWESQGLYQEPAGLFDWPQVDPQILSPGDFGFSKETPTAGYAYPQYNYLNKAGIGHNLAYAPGTRSAWMQRETAEDRAKILAAGGTPTYYTGMAGGGGKPDYAGYVDKYPGLLTAYNANSRGLTKSAWGEQHYEKHGINEGRTLETTYPLRDLMYYYGGESPMNVPGGWTPQTPPGRPASEVLDFAEGEARQPVYPIARTPLYPSGLLSPAGALPEGDGNGDGNGNGDGDGDGNGTTIDTYGGLLSQYANRMGISPAGSGKYMYNVTGEPYKVTGVKGGTGPDRSYDSYRVPLTIYGGMGGPKEAFATRQSSAEGWDPSMNLWVTRGYESGGEKVPGFNINFADWSGTPGAYVGTEREARRPVLGGLLADPQNVDVTHPTYGATQRVPWAAADYGGPSWLTTPQASAFGTGSLANWGFNPIYAWNAPQQEYFTEDVIGYGAPIYRSNWDEALDELPDLGRDPGRD